MALFPIEILLCSNLKGGSRKIKKSANDEKYKALDEKLREAIYCKVHHVSSKKYCMLYLLSCGILTKETHASDRKDWGLQCSLS